MGYNCADDPNFEPKRQCCGFTIAIFMANLYLLFAILGIYGLCDCWRDNLLVKFSRICLAVGGGLCATFYIFILHRPNYLGGNPKFYRLWLYLIGNFLIFLGYCLSSGYLPRMILTKKTIGLIVFYPIGVAISYFCYIKDDATSDSSCCSCWKPWVYKRKAFGHDLIKKGYPSYKAPAPQGYAPQGYPSYGKTPYSQSPFNHLDYGQPMKSQTVYGKPQATTPYGEPAHQAYAPQAPIQATQTSQIHAQKGFSASPQSSFSSVPDRMAPQYQEAARTTSYDYSGPKS